jgi:excisionase family DNA binding protein
MFRDLSEVNEMHYDAPVESDPALEPSQVEQSQDERLEGGQVPGDAAQGEAAAPTEWLSTQAAARRLGVTARTLYRFIDRGELPAYRMGRVIRLQASDVEAFIQASRIEPGTLEHLYPDTATAD